MYVTLDTLKENLDSNKNPKKYILFADLKKFLERDNYSEEACIYAIWNDSAIFSEIPDKYKTDAIYMEFAKSNPFDIKYLVSNLEKNMPLETAEYEIAKYEIAAMNAVMEKKDKYETGPRWKYNISEMFGNFKAFTLDVCRKMVELSGDSSYLRGLVANRIPTKFLTQDLYADFVAWSFSNIEKVPSWQKTEQFYLDVIKKAGDMSDDIFLYKNYRNRWTMWYDDEHAYENVHSKAYNFIPKEYRNDKFYKKLLDATGFGLAFIPEDKWTRQMCLDAIVKTPAAIGFVVRDTKYQPECRFENEDFLADFVRAVPNAMYYIDKAVNQVFCDATAREEESSEWRMECKKADIGYDNLERIAMEKKKEDSDSPKKDKEVSLDESNRKDVPSEENSPADSKISNDKKDKSLQMVEIRVPEKLVKSTKREGRSSIYLGLADAEGSSAPYPGVNVFVQNSSIRPDEKSPGMVVVSIKAGEPVGFSVRENNAWKSGEMLPSELAKLNDAYVEQRRGKVSVFGSATKPSTVYLDEEERDDLEL